MKKYKPDIFFSVHKNHFKALNLNEEILLKIIRKIGYKIKDSEGNFLKNFNKNEYHLFV